MAFSKVPTFFQRPVFNLTQRLHLRLSLKAKAEAAAKFGDETFRNSEEGDARQNTPSSVTDSKYVRARPFSSIPGPKQAPIFGNLLDYRYFGKFSPQTYHAALADRYKTFGPLVKENFGGRYVLHVFDPEDARVIYQNEGKTPHVVPLQETAQLYRNMRGFSLGLGNMNGDEWYRLKKNVQQAMLRPQSVFAYVPMVDEVALDFVQYIREARLSDGKLPSFQNDVSKWSLESSGMLVFEKRLNAFKTCDENSAVQKMIDSNATMFKLSGLLKFSLPFFKFFPTPKWRRLVEAEDYFYGEVSKLINETFDRIQKIRAAGKIIGEDQFNFIGYLLSKPELSQKDVYIISLSLFGDGLNTTAPALIYNAFCLASNKNVQEKLFDEVKMGINPKDGKLTASMLQKMPYLKACVKECFRLFPTGTEVSRILLKNHVLAGYQVPAGTQVEINMGPQLQSDQFFSEPHKFLPERWMKDFSSKGSHHPFVLTPFGHGPRMCAGRRFAEQDLYILLAQMVRNFRIEHCGQPVGQEMFTLLLPTNAENFSFFDR